MKRLTGEEIDRAIAKAWRSKGVTDLLTIREIEEIVAQAQLEADVKAGQESMSEPWDREQTVFGDGKKAGRREVVEWLERVKKIKVAKYQLKEWGL